MNACPAPRFRIFTVIALALSVLLGAAISQSGVADAAPAKKVSGNAVMVFGDGKAGQVLRRAGGQVLPVAPATGSRNRARQRVSTRVAGLDLNVAGANANLRGALRFRVGRRSLVMRSLKLRVNRNGAAVIRGRIGKRNMVVFNARGRSTIRPDLGTSKFNSRRLLLSGSAANSIRRALRLKRMPRGAIGSLSFFGKVTLTDPCESDPNSPGCAPEDPYLAECGVAATSSVPGNLPGAAPLPILTDAKATVGPPAIGWGFKSSFRSYIVFGANGSLQAVDGASVQAGVPVSAGFDFPVADGSYAVNDPIDTSDDQAILPGGGAALFCATGHNFRVAVSDPTIVIDGANSRIVADVDTNLSGVWYPAQRVDLATLDLSQVSPFYNRSGSEVTWSDVPVTLTEAGGDAICGTGEQSACSYTAGTELDPIDIAVRTPYDTSDLTALASYVETELPFPLTDPIAGGCTLPDPVDGNRTIDAAQVANPAAAPIWKPDATNAAALPTFTGTALTGGGLDWGFRSSLRGSINATGVFNPALGASASNTPYYGNGGLPRVSPAPGAMAGPGKFFTWPAAEGTYDPAGPGTADDRLVLESDSRVAFCQTQSAQVYGVVFSNPTIVIDGADSRIRMDVATRYRLSWVRGTVDIASLDLTDPGVTVNSVDSGGTTTVSWTFPDATGAPAVGPVSLSTDGEAVVNMLSKGTYVAGLGLDGATVRASFPTP